MVSRNPSSGKRIGLGLLVISAGWLVAASFHREEGSSAVRPIPSATPLKRDLRLLIAGDVADDSHTASSSSSSESEVEERGDEVPELQRRSFAAERAKDGAAKLP